MDDRPLTTGEIAQYCHVTHRAVLKWVVSGKLKAYRTPGKHSRVALQDFLVFLRKYSMPVPQEIAQQLSTFREKKKKILIVDDDKEMSNSIKRAFYNDDSYEIEVAYDGFSAGQKYSEYNPDLIILDIKMPGLDGYEVCSRIRKTNKDVKILSISGFADLDGIEKMIKLGANDYLAKPFTNRFLKTKIQKLLE
ncbi:MAG: response regulator [Candidatus Omnitrophota bacterium]